MSQAQSQGSAARGGRPAIPVVLAFLAVFVAAINLRPAIASLGVVITDITEHFGAGGAVAGILTALPGFCFAIFGIVAVPFSRRIGLTATMTVGMAISLVGVGLRPWVGNIWAFILLTGFVVAGIAVANVLLPAWIKLHGAKNWVALTTIYTAVLGLGGALGPLSALLFDGVNAWQWIIFIWVAPAALQLIIWVPIWLRTRNDFPRADPEAVKVPKVSMWKSPTAVALMIFFGMQSMNAYIQMGWVPTMLIDAGVDKDKSSIAVAMLGIFGLIGGLVVPTLIARVRNFQFFPPLFGALTIAGYLGLMLAPAQGWLLWAVFLGMGGFCFPTALALIPSRTVSPAITAQLSGFVQPVGYLFAGVGPLLVGAAYDALGGWTVVLVVLSATAVLKGWLGFLAARNRSVDDELGLAS
ncbi:MFS transporter [Corynebacterium sp. A21]|uniref:MFS transporter n=1 Tax=Corynebacterium sp. A21 TaxID=3457318 RepID=UPI003FD28601